MSTPKSICYRDAGVDIDEAERDVEQAAHGPRELRDRTSSARAEAERLDKCDG